MQRQTLLLLALLATAGCLPKSYRVHPAAGDWYRSLRNVAVVGSVRVNEVSVGDVREEHEEWTAQSTKHVTDALVATLKQQGFQPRLLEVARGDHELEEIRRLYQEIGYSAWMLAYPPYQSDHKVKHFEYSVGPIGKVLDRVKADALLVVHAGSDVSTTGRAIARIFAGGTYDMTLFTMGVLDREGRLMWFDVGGGAGYDLRNPDHVHQLVTRLVRNLQEMQQ